RPCPRSSTSCASAAPAGCWPTPTRASPTSRSAAATATCRTSTASSSASSGSRRASTAACCSAVWSSAMAHPVESFCRAVWKRDQRTIAALVGKVDPNGRDRFGYTPLLMAVQYSDLPLVEALIRRGADVHQGRTHLTPLTFAARRGASDIVDF